MKTISIQVYTYNELSEEAKRVANDYYYSNVEYNCDEEIKELRTLLDYFGATLQNYQFGDGSHYFKLHFNDDVAGLDTEEETARELCSRYNSYCLKPKDYYFHGKKRSSHIIEEFDCDLWTGLTFIESVAKSINNPRGRSDFEGVINEATDEVFKALEADREHFYSDESIEEFFNDNDFTFLEGGRML